MDPADYEYYPEEDEFLSDDPTIYTPSPEPITNMSTSSRFNALYSDNTRSPFYDSQTNSWNPNASVNLQPHILPNSNMMPPQSVTRNPPLHTPSSSPEDTGYVIPPTLPIESEGQTNYLEIAAFPTALQILRDPNMLEETFFVNHHHSSLFRAQQGEQASPDSTIPRTDDQKRACIRLLFMAFKSVACAKDNEKMILPFRLQRHNNHRVEAMCWDLLTAIIRRTQGGSLLKAYDPSRATTNPNISNFAQRLDAIVVAMAEQKTICKHLLDAPYINTFVDDPTKASVRVHSNRELNKKKGKVMAKGKEVLGDEEPATPKRKRTKKNDSDNEPSNSKFGDYPRVPIDTSASRTTGRSSRRRPVRQPSALTSATGSPMVKDEDRIAMHISYSATMSPTRGPSRSGYGNQPPRTSSYTSQPRQYTANGMLDNSFMQYTHGYGEMETNRLAPEWNGQQVTVNPDFTNFIGSPSTQGHQISHMRANAMQYAPLYVSQPQSNSHVQQQYAYPFANGNGNAQPVSPYISENENGFHVPATVDRAQADADDEIIDRY